MKSPKPNQNKPHHTQTMHGLAIQKLPNKPKRFITRCCPSDEEKRQQQKSNQSCDQPDEQHPINGSGIIRPAHTTKRCKHSHTNQPNKIIGTLSSSHTTHAHPNTPHYPGPAQSDLSDPTHTHTTNKIACHANQKYGSTSARFPTAISPEPLPGGALSVTLTHIKLHTPNQQHKSAG